MFQVIPYLKKLDGFSLNDKDKDEDAETIMTKELISSAINSTTPAEAGMRFVMSSFQENAKEDSNLSQGDTWSRAQSMTSLHSSGPKSGRI